MIDCSSNVEKNMLDFIKNDLRNVTFSCVISPFYWQLPEVGRGWAAVWFKIGPFDFGIEWGSPPCASL